MKAPDRIQTDRLVLRRPILADAPRIFAAYSSDPEVTRYLSWPRHTSVGQTEAFINFSDEEWTQWPAGPYMIETSDGSLLGGTGFSFQTAQRAEMGYVLRRSHWGHGYATEALRALMPIAEAPVFNSSMPFVMSLSKHRAEYLRSADSPERASSATMLTFRMTNQADCRMQFATREGGPPRPNDLITLAQ